jgi:hypothetical protein
MDNAEQPLVATWQGHCSICEQDTIFEARNGWFRDYLNCRSCPGGSIPRERAIMPVLRELAPDWKRRSIHEGSPASRGASVVLARKGSLVTFHYGYDLADLIAEWTPFDVEIRRFHQRSSGIVAEFSEVIVCCKV